MADAEPESMKGEENGFEPPMEMGVRRTGSCGRGGDSRVSVAGASQLRASATTASPETTIIDPLSRRGEEAPAGRSESEQHGKSKKHNGVVTPTVTPTAFDAVSNAVPGQTFEGVSMWDQRTLNGFYLEPPDQGMCASTNGSVGVGGRVVEAVNDVFAVYNTSGTTLKEQTLNQFFGYPDLLAGGPELTDPSCSTTKRRVPGSSLP